MNIIVVRRETRPGLAALLRKAGHEVTALGRRGGDASGADVLMVAVPGPAMLSALGRSGEL